MGKIFYWCEKSSKEFLKNLIIVADVPYKAKILIELGLS